MYVVICDDNQGIHIRMYAHALYYNTLIYIHIRICMYMYIGTYIHRYTYVPLVHPASLRANTTVW